MGKGYSWKYFKMLLKTHWSQKSFLYFTSSGQSNFLQCTFLCMHWTPKRGFYRSNQILRKFANHCVFNSREIRFSKEFCRKKLCAFVWWTTALRATRKGNGPFTTSKNLSKIQCSGVSAMEFRINSTLREQLEPSRKDLEKSRPFDFYYTTDFIGLVKSLYTE